MFKLGGLIIAASLLAGGASAATGDAYVYRVLNGYNSEPRGNVEYRVQKTEADRVELAVTPDTPSAGTQRTEIAGKDGNWLRRALASHDQLRDFAFTSPLPVYTPPSQESGSWSTRIDAVDPATGQRSSVRVDGEVLGNERVTVPAGTFDTIKIRRYMYLGDFDTFRRETKVEDVDWYAPQLGRPVRSESKSSWQDYSRCTRGGCPWFRGDWNVSELVEVKAAKP